MWMSVPMILRRQSLVLVDVGCLMMPTTISYQTVRNHVEQQTARYTQLLIMGSASVTPDAIYMAIAAKVFAIAASMLSAIQNPAQPTGAAA
mmetsp:Transcript_10033/g.15262  ORF Transcript_10033/g.15262 Transcript_10033/m.15262 type:complete len:91 (-) Transcript_10033:393-665(-)